MGGGHETVYHGDRDYVRGDVHTNTIESLFALIKRGVYRIWHSVSPKHLHRYVSAGKFRYNTGDMTDGAGTAAAILGAEGKRLSYRSATQ